MLAKHAKKMIWFPPDWPTFMAVLDLGQSVSWVAFSGLPRALKIVYPEGFCVCVLL